MTNYEIKNKAYRVLKYSVVIFDSLKNVPEIVKSYNFILLTVYFHFAVGMLRTGK